MEQLIATTIKQKNKPTIPAALALSVEDRKHLAEFKDQREMLRVRTESVATRALNGLVVYGPPGVGKTACVESTLKRLRCSYEYRDGYCTARGLYELFDTYPNSVIVLDDLHSLYGDRAAMQLLLAALGGEIGQARPITYTKHNNGDCVQFTGGIIAISNMTIPDTPMGRALQSRVVPLELNPTLRELAAAFRHYANQGYQCGAGTMEPAECRLVVDYLLEQAAGLKQAGASHGLDFRIVHQSYADYMNRRGKKGLPWQKMVLHSLRSAPAPKAVDTATKKGRLELERQAFFKAKAENDQRPKSEQLTIQRVAESVGISKTKGYDFLNGK